MLVKVKVSKFFRLVNKEFGCNQFDFELSALLYSILLRKREGLIPSQTQTGCTQTFPIASILLINYSAAVSLLLRSMLVIAALSTSILTLSAIFSITVCSFTLAIMP